MCRAVLNDKKERHEYDFHIEAAPPLGEVIYADCSWRDSSGPRIRMSHNTIASFVLTRVASLAVTDICFCSQVDKLFNPFTLLVGPCLVAYLVYKSTIPVADGGYHLPWWNIILFCLSDSPSPSLVLEVIVSFHFCYHFLWTIRHYVSLTLSNSDSIHVLLLVSFRFRTSVVVPNTEVCKTLDCTPTYSYASLHSVLPTGITIP